MKTAIKKAVQLKITSLESKVTPTCTGNRTDCEAQGGLWTKSTSTSGGIGAFQCRLGNLAVVADY